MLSQIYLDCLERFTEADSLSVNDLSVWYGLDESRVRIDELVRRGLIEQTEIIWGTDVSMPFVDRDSIKYRLSIRGRDALQARQQELEQAAQQIADQRADDDRKDELNERRNWSRFWLGLFLGWLLGAFTPVDLWAWLVRLYDAIQLRFK